MDQPISTISDVVQRKVGGCKERLRDTCNGDDKNGMVNIPLDDFSDVPVNGFPVGVIARSGLLNQETKSDVNKLDELKGLGTKLRSSRRLKGQLLAVLCCVFVTIILSLVKATNLHGTAILVNRNISQFLLLTLYNCWAVPCLTDILRRHFKLIFSRALVGTIVMCVIYSVPQYISLAKFAVLNQMTPVFTAIFGVMILHERPNTLECILGFVAIIGSVLVIQPEFMFPAAENYDDVEGDPTHASHNEYVAMSALMFGVAAEGLAMVLNRKAAVKKIPCTVLLWSHCVVSIPIVLIMHSMFYEGYSLLHGLKSCTVFGMFSLMCILFLGFANQALFLFANKYEKASVVAVISACCKIVFFFLSDLAFFPEEMNYNFVHYLGGVLIGFAVISLLVANHFKQVSFSTCMEAVQE